MTKILPIEQRESRLWHRLNSTLRQAVLRGATRPFAQNVIVNEFPKSGGSWLSQMLSEALKLPFPRNRLPMANSCIMQCHALHPWNMRDVVVIWRDGRDIMVSLYHHIIIGHDLSNSRRVQEARQLMMIEDPSDVRANLPRFIEKTMTNPIIPHFTWPRFVEAWSNRPGLIQTRYEALLQQPSIEIARITTELGRTVLSPSDMDVMIDRYSFRAQSGRAIGQERKGSFLRKGIAGDWKNYFNSEAIDIFDHFAGDALRKLGYQEAM